MHIPLVAVFFLVVAYSCCYCGCRSVGFLIDICFPVGFFQLVMCCWMLLMVMGDWRFVLVAGCGRCHLLTLININYHEHVFIMGVYPAASKSWSCFVCIIVVVLGFDRLY